MTMSLCLASSTCIDLSEYPQNVYARKKVEKVQDTIIVRNTYSITRTFLLLSRALKELDNTVNVKGTSHFA
jgi:hypothetical protein